MSTESEQPTRAELVAQAFDLAEIQGKTTREVARILAVSQSTASRLIREGRDADAWIPALDQYAARHELAARHIEILERLSTAMQGDNDKKLERFAPIWFKGAGQLAALMGLNMPTRVQNENTTTVTEPSAELAEAVRRARLNAAKERNTITGGTTDDDDSA